MNAPNLSRALALGLIAAALAVLGVGPLGAQSPSLDEAVKEVSTQLRCPVCRQQSIEESPSQMAIEMKAIVREKLEAGEDADEVIEYFVARYGEWVLLKPKATGFNLAVWVLPPLLVLLGGLVVVRAFRRWMAPELPVAVGPDGG